MDPTNEDASQVDAGAVGDPIELAGVVRAARGGAVVAGASTVTIGALRHDATWGEPFAIETEGGARVRVTPPARLEDRLVPRTAHRLRWEELDAELRARHAAIAPAPGTRVRLEEATVRDGARVTVVGRVAEVGPVGGGEGYRAAPARRVVAVDAAAIGVGPGGARAARDAASRPDATLGAADRPSVWRRASDALWAGLPIALMLAPLVILALRRHDPIVRDPLVWAGWLAWWAAGAVWARRVAPLRPTTERETGATGFLAGILGFTSGFFVFLSAIVTPRSGSPPETAAFLVSILLVMQVMLAVQVVAWLVVARRFRRLFTPGPDWRVIEGRIEGDGGGDRLLLDTGAGERVVVLDGALRASDDLDSETRGEGRGATTTYYHQLRPGDRVAVAGRFDDAQAELRARGPRSLVVFGCGPGGEPLAALGRRLRALAWTAGVVVAATVASLAVAIAAAV